MLAEDLRSIVSDAVNSTSLTNDQAVAMILRRLNGTNIEQVLAAAVMVAREEIHRIDNERATEAEEFETDRWAARELETDLRGAIARLETQTEDLLRQLKELRP